MKEFAAVIAVFAGEDTEEVKLCANELDIMASDFVKAHSDKTCGVQVKRLNAGVEQLREIDGFLDDLDNAQSEQERKPEPPFGQHAREALNAIRSLLAVRQPKRRNRDKHKEQ